MFLVGALLRFGSVTAWIIRLVACMGGCLGGHTKPKLTTAIDGPLKGRRLQGPTVSKRSISEDFWTTSTCEMENSAVMSRGSNSSISTSNQAIDPHGNSSVNTPSEYVNHGLLLWNQTRKQWLGNKSWNATYDSLLGSNKRFPHRIPLSEMVDFLVDIWEQEGMYD